MNRFSGLLAIMLLAGCTQLTTNDAELAELERVAAGKGDVYVNCVVSAGTTMANAGNMDVATAQTMATTQCQPQLDAYSAAQEKFLGATVMMTSKPLQQSIDALNENATQQIGANLLASAEQQPAAVPVAAAVVTGSAAATATARPPAAASAPAGDWNPDQRIYLDCMEDQAMKYATLNESATTIADVAQSRCKDYMGGYNAALEQEGRAVAMGTVMDAKLGATRPPSQARP